MSRITIASSDAEADIAERGLILEMEPSALEMPPTDEWVDIVAGYEVSKVTATKHDGVPATLITLSDSLGNREVGILRIRNDAIREAQLEVTRLFADSATRDEFVSSLEARPANLPDGFEQVEARTIVEGDTVYLEQDPNDPDLERHVLVPVKRVELEVYKGKVLVSTHWVEDAGTDLSGKPAFVPGEWSDWAPDAKAWVKRA